MKRLLIPLLLIATITFAAPPNPINGKTPKGHEYRAYSVKENAPLLVYLHGFNANRKKVEQIDNEGFVKNFVAKYSEFYTIVAPLQLPNYTGWQGNPKEKNDAVEFIEEIQQIYSSDGRLYVTGHSMGGKGTWDVVSLMGSKVTAFVVSAGRSDDRNGVLRAAKLHIPGRHYHGDLDRSENSFERGKQVCRYWATENDPILIVYKGYGHTDRCYMERDLNEFFLSKGTPKV